MNPVSITAYTASSAIGRGCAQTLDALRQRRSGLRLNDFCDPATPGYIGRMAGVEDEALPDYLAQWECRNNRIAWIALCQDGFMEAVARARERHGAHRVAVLLGTSTSSIGATEEAYRRMDAQGRFPDDLMRAVIHTPHSSGAFVQDVLNLTGICMTVGTACSSSAKVFAQAQRLLHADVADAVVVGGADSLCGSVLYGFNAMQLLSAEPCRPFDSQRSGINLGEAAGFALLERSGAKGASLLGYGETSDAHHMSAPHPEARSVTRAIGEALRRAGVTADAIDYINLHGTASLKNDEVEAAAIGAMFPSRCFASSTKGWTGHTLGAAGILEAVITLLVVRNGCLPGTLNSEDLDAACGPQFRTRNVEAPVRHAMSLSFGFGGSNCVLVFGEAGQDR